MDRLICGDVGLWQDRGCAARGVQGRHGRQAGRDSGADHGPGAAALHQLQPAPGRVPGHRRDALSLPDAVATGPRPVRAGERVRSTSSSARTACSATTSAFKDLGLLIVDEEQRFGVGHKEKIKQLRTEVDVLTLTATPIPRTLHMSLTGVRDLSTIDTPPEDRLPIKTFVGDFDEGLVRQADPARDRPQRAGVLRPQPGAGHRADRGEGEQDRARGADRDRPRPDAREGAVRGDAGVRRRRLRRAGLHDHHRERARHSERQHHHHQPGRYVRAGAALPVARPRRPFGGARVRLPAGRQIQGAERGRPATSRRDPGGERPGRGLPHRHARPGDSRRGRTARRPAARPYRGGRV